MIEGLFNEYDYFNGIRCHRGFVSKNCRNDGDVCNVVDYLPVIKDKRRDSVLLK
jgi:hypothetical protein